MDKYELFLTKLDKLGLCVSELNEKYGDAIKTATFSFSSDNGLAYEGALVDVLLYKLTPYAIKINELLPENVRVDKNTLVKVCLLHQISKSLRYVKNDNEWEVKNRSMAYTFTKNLPAIKTGLHSLIMAQNCGIEFTPEEAEAMVIIDREPNDEQARWHSSVLSTIIKQANELVYIEANTIASLNK